MAQQKMVFMAHSGEEGHKAEGGSGGGGWQEGPQAKGNSIVALS